MSYGSKGKLSPSTYVARKILGRVLKLLNNRIRNKTLKNKVWHRLLKVNESWYIALFVFTGSIKKLFSIDYVNIYLLSTFFAIDFTWWKSMGLPHFALYSDSLTLKSKILKQKTWFPWSKVFVFGVVLFSIILGLKIH